MPIFKSAGSDRVHVEMTSYVLSKGRIVFSVPGPDKAQLVRADATTLRRYDGQRRRII